MPIQIPRGESDEIIDQIIAALRRYEAEHPQAQIDLYRQNSVSVRIRIVDPGFCGKSRRDRSQQAWQYLEELADEVQADISTLILLTPEEQADSFANHDFDDPIPSNL